MYKSLLVIPPLTSNPPSALSPAPIQVSVMEYNINVMEWVASILKILNDSDVRR